MLIIKGAIYTDGGNLYRAHMTGDFWAVDCDEYLPKDEIISRYGKEKGKAMLKNAFYLTNDGKKYFQAEYSPVNTSGLELLSDLSSIEFFDEETKF